MTTGLVTEAQVFLLIFARVFALLQVAPLLSSSAVSQLVRVSLSLLAAFVVFPSVTAAGAYPIPDTLGAYVLLLVGEVLVGVVIGFFVSIIFTAFQSAGQFFSLQVGFGASQVFDPLSQVEIPLMGQFFNIVAMMLFVTTDGFQKLFYVGVYRSFQSLRAVDLATHRGDFLELILSSLSRLFEQALILALPILGTLVLVSITMGLLGKAAPQMNLLLLGFPLSLGVAFLMLVIALPFLVDAFDRLIGEAFDHIGMFISRIGEAGAQ